MDNTSDIVLEEYKSYVSNVLRSSFDYSTWYQHQYGKIPTRNVDASLTFKVLQDKKSHK